MRFEWFQSECIGPLSTPFGHSQAVYKIDSESGCFLYISRYGEKRAPITATNVNYRANIYALKELGVKQIVSFSGPGAINSAYKIGQYVIVDDIIDETKNRKYTFFENKNIGFIRQNPVFCPFLRSSIINTLKYLKLDCAESGTYVCAEGPRLETSAEIRKYASFGSELVGTVLIPEVFLAKELEMCYAAICYIANYAEGVVEREFRPGEPYGGLNTENDFEAVRKCVEGFPAVINTLANTVSNDTLKCKCALSMERYKKNGTIEDDWHTWVDS